jgi:RNA polymerase sigma-70 factor (ECF subfamily)
MKEPAIDGSEAPTDSAEGGFEAFFHAHYERLLRAMFVVTGSAEEADELTQEAFVAVWERWDRVGVMRDPAGYLYRTAMNRFRSRLRAAGVAARRALRAEPPRDPFEAVDRHDLVVRALARLSVRQRAALVLVELLDLDSEEAGRVLGIRPATVRALASQGRAALRRSVGRVDE